MEGSKESKKKKEYMKRREEYYLRKVSNSVNLLFQGMFSAIIRGLKIMFLHETVPHFYEILVLLFEILISECK